MKFKNRGFSKNINDYFNHYIDMADAKAGGVLGVSFVIIGFLLNLKPTCKTQEILFYASCAFLIISSILAIVTTYPRLSKAKKGFIFWENVKQFSSKEEYISELKDLDEDMVEYEYAQQNYFVSKIVSKKQMYVRTSMIFLCLGIISTSILYCL